MNKKKIIIYIIYKNTKIDSKVINEKSKMSEFSKWDSLCHLTIILELQKQFKKNVNTSKMNDLNSVQKIFQFFE